MHNSLPASSTDLAQYLHLISAARDTAVFLTKNHIAPQSKGTELVLDRKPIPILVVDPHLPTYNHRDTSMSVADIVPVLERYVDAVIHTDDHEGCVVADSMCI